MAVAATQGADQHIRSSLGFSILPKDNWLSHESGANLPIYFLMSLHKESIGAQIRDWLHSGRDPATSHICFTACCYTAEGYYYRGTVITVKIGYQRTHVQWFDV